MDSDGAITFTCTNCAGWMTFTNNGDGSSTEVSTYTISGTPTDAQVAATTITINAAQGGTTAQQSLTITVTQVNDAPSLSVTVDGGTATEDGSAVDLYDSVTAADGDSVPTQSFTELLLTVTNVADTTEYLNVNGLACDLTDSLSLIHI